jgi:hypothetical protein
VGGKCKICYMLEKLYTCVAYAENLHARNAYQMYGIQTVNALEVKEILYFIYLQFC